MDTPKVKVIWIMSVMSLIIAYGSACKKADEHIVLNYTEHDSFSISSSSGLGSSQILRMLEGSILPFKGFRGRNVSVSFQVDKDKPIFFTKICMYVRCVMKIIVDYYGPWGSDVFFDITKTKKWIDIPPTHFSDQKSFTTCGGHGVCFLKPGLLTNFTLTFMFHECRSCRVIRVRNLRAKECRESTVTTIETLTAGSLPILDGRNYHSFNISSEGIQPDDILRMLKHSGDAFEVASGLQQFSVTFEVKNSSTVDVGTLCVTTTCVQMIEALLYGPWKRVSFKDWTQRDVWIEVPPVEFPDQKLIKNGCRTTETCFISLGNLTKFKLTFELKPCRRCKSMRIEHLYAEDTAPGDSLESTPLKVASVRQTTSVVTTLADTVTSIGTTENVKSTIVGTSTKSIEPNASSISEAGGTNNTSATTTGPFQNETEDNHSETAAMDMGSLSAKSKNNTTASAIMDTSSSYDTDQNSSASVVADTLSSIITVGMAPMIVPINNSSET